MSKFKKDPFMKTNSFYHRIFHSPYLSEQMHHLHSNYLLPTDVHKAFGNLQKAVTDYQKEDDALRFRHHNLGLSTSGEHALIGWTLGKPELPRILCASQHHGPENIGPSFCFYLTYLLLKDPLFKPWLEQYSFSFFPQQNPDGLTLHGNQNWLKDIHWEKFIQFHQYDPRQWDVEHGVLSSWFDKNKLHLTTQNQACKNSFRAETLGLIKWIEQETSRYGPIHFYLSGHSWDLLDAPLYLVYPNQIAESKKSQLWAQKILKLTKRTPYKSLSSQAPLTEEYVLPKWNTQSAQAPTPQNGFFVLPTQSAFKAQNQTSNVRQSTLDYVYSTSPQLYACVVEPPIFTSKLFQDPSPTSKHGLATLMESINLHQATVNLLTNTLTSFYDPSAIYSLEQLYITIPNPLKYYSQATQETHRDYLRLICELRERQTVKQQWERLLNKLQADYKFSLDQFTEGQIQLARANQLFHTGNLLALSLRYFQQPEIVPCSNSNFEQSKLNTVCNTLSESYNEVLAALVPFKLQHWPISHSCFVYLNALWAFVEADELPM